MEENQKIEDLIQECITYFECNCYTKHRIERYNSMWKNGISRYMKDKCLIYYNRAVGEAFIQGHVSAIVTPGERDFIRSINVLNELQETGKMSKRTVHPRSRKLDGEIGKAIERMLSHLKELRRSEITLNNHFSYLYRFNKYLEFNGIELLEDISEEHLLSFVSNQVSDKANIVTSLRVFFRYLNEERLLKTDLSYVLANYKSVKREKLPSIYSLDEVKQIESTIERSGAVGKRNYAVLLLATRLGLRASDIAYLSFDNLDWENSRIVLQQYKTGKTIELPLLTETGDAIINYLKYGRPKSGLSTIFLSARAPYRAMGQSAVSSAVRQIIESSGVVTEKRKKGPHAMRHSLAGRLLENSVSLPVISETLGHDKTETTMSYLRIDIKALRRCSLEVPAVDAAFYNQKGGVFYE